MPQDRTALLKWFPEGVRTRLLAAFMTLLLAAVTLAVGSWRGLHGTQGALADFETDVMPDIARALGLAERTAQLAAIAPHLVESRTQESLDTASTVAETLLVDVKRRSAELPSKQQPVLNRLLDGVGRDLSTLIALAQQKQRLQAQLQHEIARLNELGTRFRSQGSGRHQDPALVAVWASLAVGMTSNSQATWGELEADVEALMLAAQKRGALTALDPDVSAALRDIVSGPQNVLSLKRSLDELEQRTSYLVALTRTNADQLSYEMADFVAQLRSTAAERSGRVNSAIRSGETAMLVLALVSMVIAAVAMRYVWQLVAQIETITSVMSRLAQGDTAQTTPATSRRDELGALARSFEVFRDTLLAKHQLVTELKSQSELLHAVHSSMTDALAVFDQQGRMLMWNPQLLGLLGPQARQPTVGIGLRELLANFPPGGTWMAPGHTPPQSLDGARESDLAAFGQIELHLPGAKVLDLRSRAMPGVGTVTLITDLSTRRAIEAQVQHNQRLELLGQLTGGVAHDFNNHLGTIMGNLSLLEDENGLDEPGRQRLQRALRATARASALTRRLLAFARRQPLQAEAVPVDLLIEDMRDLIEYSAGPLVTLKLTLLAPGVHVHVDRGQLENALLNLVINSAAAMPAGGLLTVGTRLIVAPPGEEVTRVAITVEDTGTGIPDDVLHRVFEPFFTTKPVTEGSGLGLSIVYGFVKQSGGQVAIRSQYGSGTCVTLQFPAAPVPGRDGGSRPALEVVTADEPELPPWRVLLVDDDEALRATVTDMLKNSRVTVTTATSAEAALQMLEATPDAFDVMLSDLRLGPGLDGLRLCTTARERWPALQVTLMSGLSPQMFVQSPDAEWPAGLPFLQKPFDRRVLRQWLRGFRPTDEVPKAKTA